MNNNIDIKIQLEILSKEYPNLSFNSDNEIERYFELRKAGRTREALSIYNAFLRIRYPDDVFRTELMRSYRSKSPDFSRLLHLSIIQKAQQLTQNIIRVITILTDDIEALNMNDAYTVIRVLERVLLSLAQDKYQAVAKAEKIKRYAAVFAYREKKMEHVVSMLRLYITNGMDMVRNFRQNLAREKQQKKVQTQTAVFDFKKLQFSDYDIARITISSAITRPEDKVLAYCIKYWNFVFDAEFEKIVYLYAKKYESRHYEIFNVIKRGKTLHSRDEEILNTVLSYVTAGYYYNINGDLYLQHMWRRVKERLTSNIAHVPAAGRKALPAPEQKKVPAINQESAPIVKKKSPSKGALVPVVLQKKVERLEPEQSSEITKKQEKVVKYTSSVSDIIKRVTETPYDLYKDLFFAQVRPSIRIMLVKNKIKKTLFDAHQNDAEEVLYVFLQENYENPFMNWEASPEKKQVYTFGYNIDSVEPIIVHWHKKRQV